MSPDITSGISRSLVAKLYDTIRAVLRTRRIFRPSMNELYTIRETCRICGGSSLRTFLDFGRLPLAGRFIKPDEIKNELLLPLSVCFCEECAEVQTRESVSSEVLFRDYRFLASATATLSGHFVQYADEMSQRFLGPESLVVEIGSNDGVLLTAFSRRGIRAVGVEPARNIAEVATSRGCEVINDFFRPSPVEKLQGKADLICANNVLAHIDDMHEVLQAVKMVLSPRGVLVFEVHYLMDLLDSYQYDMIYHEHMMYHSLRPISRLLEQWQMKIFDVKRVPTHSGSIRVYAQPQGNEYQHPQSSEVERLLNLEEQKGLYSFDTYLQFGHEVFTKRDALVALVSSLISSGKKVVGYGASGRASVHLNLCKFGPDKIPYVVDGSIERAGRLVPGTHNPIVLPEKFRADNADYAVVFAYNYLQEILDKEKDFLARGGKFIVPLPEPKIIE
ncbi:MAG: class I SAM-dependent methyltransferase [Deltaproteobacteria bacterium]|nr:class I SAM-dependent methyltransferase [Deltaproteobacteria bacterium]